MFPGLAQVLMAVSVALVARVLTSLGMGVISYAAITTFVNFIVGKIMLQIGMMTGSAVMVMALAGIFEALSIILAALALKAQLLALKRFGFL